MHFKLHGISGPESSISTSQTSKTFSSLSHLRHPKMKNKRTRSYVTLEAACILNHSSQNWNASKTTMYTKRWSCKCNVLILIKTKYCRFGVGVVYWKIYEKNQTKLKIEWKKCCCSSCWVLWSSYPFHFGWPQYQYQYHRLNRKMAMNWICLYCWKSIIKKPKEKKLFVFLLFTLKYRNR